MKGLPPDCHGNRLPLPANAFLNAGHDMKWITGRIQFDRISVCLKDSFLQVSKLHFQALNKMRKTAA